MIIREIIIREIFVGGVEFYIIIIIDVYSGGVISDIFFGGREINRRFISINVFGGINVEFCCFFDII